MYLPWRARLMVIAWGLVFLFLVGRAFHIEKCLFSFLLFLFVCSAIAARIF